MRTLCALHRLISPLSYSFLHYLSILNLSFSSVVMPLGKKEVELPI